MGIPYAARDERGKCGPHRPARLPNAAARNIQLRSPVTNTKAIIARHLTLNLTVQTCGALLLGIPSLDAYRLAFANTLGLDPQNLWLLIGACMLGITLFSIGRIGQLLGEPMRDISEQCKNNQPYNLQHDYSCVEEKLIRDYLVQLQARAQNASARLERAESELLSTRKERDRAVVKKDETEDLLAVYARIRQELSIDNATLRSEKESLAEALTAERRNKVGVEVEKRTEEIYEQVERAMNNAAIRSLWLPRFVNELRTPINIIHGLAHRMVKSWDQTTLEHLRQSAQEIHFQSEVQLERLRALPVQESDDESNSGETLPAWAPAEELPPAPTVAERLNNSLQDIFETDGHNGLSFSLAVTDDAPEIPPDDRSVALLRGICHFVRNEAESGRVEVTIDGDDEGQPVFEVDIEGTQREGKPLSKEAVEELAQRHGVEAEMRYGEDAALSIRFPTRLAIVNEQQAGRDA